MSWEDLELIQLDREIARAARAWVRWRRQLRAGSGLDSEPFAAFPFVSRIGFEHVAARPKSDPLRDPTLRFLYRLVDDKACRESIVAVERARRHARFIIHSPERAELSLAELLSRALSDAPRRRPWLERWLEHSVEHAARVREHWELRQDVARRLRLENAAELASPCRDDVDVARAWLRTTSDAAAEQRASDLASSVEVSLGLEASEGWPARLSPRSLGQLLGDSELVRGMSLDLGTLPATLAPSSFLRGLARLGAAWADAGASTRQPFVVAHDPFGLRRFSCGALFSLLPLSRPHARRVRGLSPSRLSDQLRVLSRVVMLESRRAALRVVLREHALHSSKELMAAFEALTHEALGVALPPRLAGAVLRLHADDAQRFAGLLLASVRRERLTEEHDDDWYRNPRATEELRAEIAEPPPCLVSRQDLDEGARSLFALLSSHLG